MACICSSAPAGTVAEAFLASLPPASGRASSCIIADTSTQFNSPQLTQHLQPAAQHVVRSFRAHCRAGPAARGAFCAWLQVVLTRSPALVAEGCLAAGLVEAALDVLAAGGTDGKVGSLYLARVLPTQLFVCNSMAVNGFAEALETK